eukprot:214745-Hanusia_phi.AAC.2
MDDLPSCSLVVVRVLEKKHAVAIGEQGDMHKGGREGGRGYRHGREGVIGDEEGREEGKGGRERGMMLVQDIRCRSLKRFCRRGRDRRLT